MEGQDWAGEWIVLLSGLPLALWIGCGGVCVISSYGEQRKGSVVGQV